MTTTSDPIVEAGASLDAELARLAAAIEKLTDGDLHRGPFDGGWTISIVVSHINVCTLVWMGDMHRLAADPELRFFFREEVGHDLTGFPPPTREIALGQLASTRRTLATGVPAVSSEVLDRTVEIPDLGTMTVREWIPLILGHLQMHVGQAFEVMDNRGFRPEGSLAGPSIDTEGV